MLSLYVAPMRGRGLKHSRVRAIERRRVVAPMRGRGLKLEQQQQYNRENFGRPHAGAWIETV